MRAVFLSIGSNTGNRAFYLEQAVAAINHTIGEVTACSSVYETQSWGFEGQNFLNMAVKVDSNMVPLQILTEIKMIEAELGRTRTPGKYSDRTIDLDILFYASEAYADKDITIPHPRLHERLFVLEPMMEIAPEFIHPVLCKTIKQLLEDCPDKGWIRKVP